MADIEAGDLEEKLRFLEIGSVILRVSKSMPSNTAGRRRWRKRPG